MIYRKLHKKFTNVLSKKIYIYSYGGSGTRMFYEFVKNYRPVNSQTDVHNGLIVKKYPFEKVVYLVGNPVNAVISFYRRHTINLKFIKEHTKNLNIDEFEANSLEDYVKQGKDLFQLEKHFEKYTSNELPYPILFIKYEKLWDNLDSIFEYLGLKKYIRGFPNKLDRKSNYKRIDSRLKYGLVEIYSNLLSKIDEMSDIKIINKKT